MVHVTLLTPTRYTLAGADASSEGVQRDLLPIIEGSVVTTKHGNVNTDHILFICSGAFHSCKPSDMLAELQGRLPVRVELKGLTCASSSMSSLYASSCYMRMPANEVRSCRVLPLGTSLPDVAGCSTSL